MGILVFASSRKIELYVDVHVRSSMSGLMGKWHVSRLRREEEGCHSLCLQIKQKVELIKTIFFCIEVVDPIPVRPGRNIAVKLIGHKSPQVYDRVL